MLGKANLAPRPIPLCCPLANLIAWFLYHCWFIVNVLYRQL